jgi:hypothetical protein
MKKNVLLFIVSSVIFMSAWQCASQKTQYVFPPYMMRLNQDSLIARCNKGKMLFKEHCDGCHGIFSKGKDGIPNFSKDQVDTYNEMAMMRDPKNHAVMIEMPYEELDAVKMFLTYRKHDETKKSPAGNSVKKK